MVKKILSILIFTIVSSCGFKVVNLSEIENFSFIELNLTGDKRINYIIKNNLLQASKENANNKIVITINTKKNKNIKEKNIKNEIIKYDISIVADILVKSISKNASFDFTITKNGSYSVAEQNSTTRNNERKLITLLSGDLSDEILAETRVKVNDL
tara:strand:+ start:728 stop:1195 length:468 start_codon:yes stop_codon:yes gene_type:complete